MGQKYRLELWIVAILLTLFVLPFVSAAEDFYAERLGSQEGAQPSVSQQERLSLPEDGVENAIDRQ